MVVAGAILYIAIQSVCTPHAAYEVLPFACRLRKLAADYKRQAAEAKRRMEGALQDQRRLAQKARFENGTSWL